MTYISKLKQIMKHNPDKDLGNIGQRDVEGVIIQIKESAYYLKEYKEETKSEYWDTLKRRLGSPGGKWICCLKISSS